MIRALTTTQATLLLAAILSSGAPPLGAQSGEAHRDSYQRVPDVVAALGAVPGAHVADVGAGGGYFTTRLRDAVGPEGRVYAVDISRQALARLRSALDREGARNVDVILGESDDPRLPFGSLDAALIVNAYHEMTEYRAMLAGLLQALRPGGRLVILDNPPADRGAPREAQTRDHDIDIGLVAADLREAGFELLREDPDFIADTSDGHDHRMWLIAARRPLRDPLLQRFPAAPAGPDGAFACPFPDSPAALAERLSPPDSAATVVAGGRVKVCYSRPSARGRVIMGELVPFDEPWRTGANEATALRTERPLDVGGIRLEPGWYSLYTVPGARAWTVVLNRLADRQGIPIDDFVRDHDVGRLTVPVEPTGEHRERLGMRFESVGPAAATLVVEWESARVRIPVRVVP